MELWNFVHLTLGTHVYLLFALILLVVMVILGIGHTIRQKKRDLENEEELRSLSADSSSKTTGEVPEGPKED